MLRNPITNKFKSKNLKANTEKAKYKGTNNREILKDYAAW